MSEFENLFDDDLTDEPPEFAELLETSMHNLQFLTSNHQAVWQIDQAERWDLDQADGDLVFTYPDGIVSTPAQIIGSFDTRTSMWLWSWANPSIVDPLKRDALQVLEYGREHRIARLTTPEWKADETDAWYMTALANTLCRRNGAYRGPTGPLRTFITFGEIVGTRFNGKLVIEFGSDAVDEALPPAERVPDLSHVTSTEVALKLASESKLAKMLLVPAVFNGADIPLNVVYVPPGVLEIQDRIIRIIIPYVRKGLHTQFECRPEYKGDSFVPAKIHYEASESENNWHFERTIEIW